MHTIQSEFYGDKSRWFIATVVDNSPPAGLEGKVKVAIKGIHSQNVEDISFADLPWADVLIPSSVGGSTGHGEIPRLVPYTLVYGTFLDGELSQQPLVLGQLHTIERPSDIQIDLAADSSKPLGYPLYELPEPERALTGDIRSYGADGEVVSPIADYEENNSTVAGYTHGEVATGVLSISVETDFTLDTVLGDAIVYNNEKLSTASVEPKTVSLSKEEFSLNYIGATNRNANPSFSSSSTSRTVSAQNTIMTGLSTTEEYLAEVVTVGAPAKYKKAMDYVKGLGYIDEDDVETEVGKLKK